MVIFLPLLGGGKKMASLVLLDLKSFSKAGFTLKEASPPKNTATNPPSVPSPLIHNLQILSSTPMPPSSMASLHDPNWVLEFEDLVGKKLIFLYPHIWDRLISLKFDIGSRIFHFCFEWFEEKISFLCFTFVVIELGSWQKRLFFPYMFGFSRWVSRNRDLGAKPLRRVSVSEFISYCFLL